MPDQNMQPPRKGFKFPLWGDVLLSLGLLVLACVEWMNGHRLWAVLFAFGGVFLCIGLIIRLKDRGSKNES